MENTMWTACTFLTMLVLLVLLPSASAQESAEPVPRVLQHSDPAYPPLARQTRTKGDVRVKVTTDGESVRDAVAQSCHPLLCKAAEDNARTWKFASSTPSTFYVTFRYKLLEGTVEVEFLESGGIVEVLASPPELISDYGDIGFGTWKAEIRSTYGKFWRVFELSSTGSDGTWLNARTLNPKGESEESDFGHIEAGFLAFTLTISRPGGGSVKAFFVGKITGDKIVGTFVDVESRSGT
jgi:hypothetical protein